MFTGIIQHKGTVARIQPVGDAKTFWIDAGELAASLRCKDSLAVNGVCLTVEANSGAQVQLTAIHQTLGATNLGDLVQGASVNLETAATLNTFLGGHMVMGHVDGTIEVREVLGRQTGCEVILSLPESLRRYVIDKGSVTLDGVSLTVAELMADAIRIALIPETLERTILSDWRPGQRVNLEVDAIGKYVENFLTRRFGAENS